MSTPASIPRHSPGQTKPKPQSTTQSYSIPFFIQILLDQLSAGAEHGHLHIHAEKPWQPWIILGGLCLHSVLEGLPLIGHAELLGHHPTDFMAAVTLHKVP